MSVWDDILILAKQLDTPEMRILYREQFKQEGFNKSVNDLSEEVESIFNNDSKHGGTPDGKEEK